MAVPITRYRASERFLWLGLVALLITLFSGWVAIRWPYAWISAGLAFTSSIALFLLASRPVIEIYESQLRIGKRSIPWNQIRRLDRVLEVPLVVRLGLREEEYALLVYAGDPDASESLLRHLRRHSREALIDGVPYRQFWGDNTVPSAERKQVAPKRYPLLLAEDEAEVERLFQRLKAVGHLDSKSDDK